nr:MAG TPA: hypothetical protein [Bacteriophage sp.]
MFELREKLCEELERAARKENLSMGDLDMLHKLASTIKNLDKIMMRDGGRYLSDGYSREGYSRDGDREADMRGSYGRGSSYARRGMHYVRGHYSRSAGEMKEQLRELMQGADDDATRDAIRRCMESIGRE